MSVASELDLTAVEWPACLFAVNRFLDRAPAGRILDVFVRDPDVACTIAILVANSGRRMHSVETEGDRIHLRIRKPKP